MPNPTGILQEEMFVPVMNVVDEEKEDELPEHNDWI
jgi:hypothetical protein